MDPTESQGQVLRRDLVCFLWCAWVKLASPVNPISNRGSLLRLINFSSTACYSVSYPQLSGLLSTLSTHTYTHPYHGFIPIPVCNRLINTGNFHLLPALAERNGARQKEKKARENMPELLISCAVEIGQATQGSVSQTPIHSVNMTLMAAALLFLVLLRQSAVKRGGSV